MNGIKKITLGILSLGLCSLSFSQETAKVLPKGINRTRGVLVFGKVEDKYNANGDREVLAAPLNRSIKVAEMAGSSATLASLYNALNSLEPGLGDSVYQTNLYTDVKMKFQQYTVAHEYGITSKLSLGLIVPYSRLKVDGSFKAESQNSIAAVRARSTGVITDEQWAQLQSQMPNTATMEAALLTQKGYKPIQNFQVAGLGDIEAGVKYNFLNIRDKFLLATKTGFRLPTTSHVADERNILDQSTGDKQLDYAVQLVAEYLPVKQFSIAGAAQGTMQFKDELQNKALLKKNESGLPDLTNPDNRDNVRRDLGDVLDAEIGTSYGFLGNTLAPSVVYSYYYKQADKYSGGKSYLNYAALGADSQASAHRWEAGLKYSTIPLFAQKKFPVPFETKISYQNTFAGKNTVDRKYYRFDMILYF